MSAKTKQDGSSAPSGTMPVQGHLVELRSRLGRSLIALLVGVIIAFAFYNQIFNILLLPLNQVVPPEEVASGAYLIRTELTEFIGVWFRVCLIGGLVIAMPYLVYQVFAYIAPALTSKEKRYVFSILPAVIIMFLFGVAFAYYVALPPAVGFLYEFGSEVAAPQIRIANYINIVTRLIMAVGVAFETPIIIMFLARMGLVTPQWLAGKRKVWIVLAFVISAMITPTFDPINQSIIAAPLIVLFELSIWLSKIVYRKRASTEVAPTTS